ncbi:hypothetical protein GCM10018790_38770 [Kitasatospora xanthocidica]|uniref:hypothetical protein n=1 Tax=Kitasatospora xanthocidica TaxID=83382 RepID=UPI00167AF04A|nr:hypothetical protein [Kitasatospora xanthocidica]GHF56995.1 hypothetical protein GCM10018790_38770 [Kitasatospora xanthocidica]
MTPPAPGARDTGPPAHRVGGTDVRGYVTEGPGLSAYALANGTVHRTPMGRHEDGEETHWLRRHDEYGKA